MPLRLVLYNGLELTDDPPGFATRYKMLLSGA